MLLYGAKPWIAKKVHEKRLYVTEMRMLRWSCRVTCQDRIRNEANRNRGKIKVTELSKKVQEKRLQQYGHVEKIEENYIGKRVAKMRVDGNKVRGRPKKI